MPITNERLFRIAKPFLRVSLSAAFLSSMADRFGLYGPPGKGASWGDWPHFVQFVGVLNWFMPKAIIPALSVVETIIELVLAIALLLPFYKRIVALATSALLLSFAFTMWMALGISAPLGYSVFTASAAALLLSTVSDQRSPHGADASL
jgi:putative oxidoreductase